MGLLLSPPATFGVDELDDHKFERLGESAFAVDLPADRQPDDWTKRALAGVLIEHGPVPEWLSDQVSDALFDLNMGRLPSLFSPHTKKRTGMAEGRLQLTALKMVRYRRSRYRESAGEAETKIASALSVDVKTLQSWRSKTFGAMPDFLSRAYNEVEVTAFLARGDATAIAEADAMYGDPALLELAQQYKEAVAERGKAKRRAERGKAKRANPIVLS
jgi:hypothetical protein